MCRWHRAERHRAGGLKHSRVCSLIVVEALNAVIEWHERVLVLTARSWPGVCVAASFSVISLSWLRRAGEASSRQSQRGSSTRVPCPSTGIGVPSGSGDCFHGCDTKSFNPRGCAVSTDPMDYLRHGRMRLPVKRIASAPVRMRNATATLCSAKRGEHWSLRGCDPTVLGGRL